MHTPSHTHWLSLSVLLPHNILSLSLDPSTQAPSASSAHATLQTIKGIPLSVSLSFIDGINKTKQN